MARKKPDPSLALEPILDRRLEQSRSFLLLVSALVAAPAPVFVVLGFAISGFGFTWVFNFGGFALILLSVGFALLMGKRNRMLEYGRSWKAKAAGAERATPWAAATASGKVLGVVHGMVPDRAIDFVFAIDGAQYRATALLWPGETPVTDEAGMFEVLVDPEHPKHLRTLLTAGGAAPR